MGLTEDSLSWAVFQEAITTVPYPVRPPTDADPNPPTERFTYSVVLNTIQSSFAAVTGFLYLYFSSRSSKASMPSVFPNRQIVFPLVLVSITSSLASPFGYASLAHIDYLTFILAKSCKLLPVMFLHVVLYRRRYPLYKYAVVLLVTAGVTVFTLYHPSTSKKAAAAAEKTGTGRWLWGLFLLSINLLLDGLTNTTQDHIFSSPARYTRYTGPQMMVAQNFLCTVLTVAYLLLTPFLAAAGSPLQSVVPASASSELSSAIAFLQRHPRALKDVLGFAACGAIGQVFIYMTLSRFSSLLLVSVTVTRKMLSMLLSVFWFGHSLNPQQWLGVLLVFGGVGAEGIVQRREKLAKARAKKDA